MEKANGKDWEGHLGVWGLVGRRRVELSTKAPHSDTSLPQQSQDNRKERLWGEGRGMQKATQSCLVIPPR